MTEAWTPFFFDGSKVHATVDSRYDWDMIVAAYRGFRTEEMLLADSHLNPETEASTFQTFGDTHIYKDPLRPPRIYTGKSLSDFFAEHDMTPSYLLESSADLEFEAPRAAMG